MKERLRAVRRENKEAERRNVYEDPVTGEKIAPEEHDRSLQEVIQSHDLQLDFFNFLGSVDKRRAAALIESYSAGREWTDSQLKFLESNLTRFNARDAELERLNSVLSIEYVHSLAEVNGNISLIVAQIGAEKAQELLAKQLRKLGFSDPKGYAKVVEGMRKEREVSESPHLNHVNVRVRHYLERVGVPEERLGKYVKKSIDMRKDFDSGEKRALEEEAKKNMGILMKLANFVSRGKISSARAENFIHAFKKQREYLHESDDFLSITANALNATITKEQRAEMRRILVDGGEIKDVPEANVNALQDVKSVCEQADGRLRTAIEKEARRLNKLPSAFTSQERDAVLDTFSQDEELVQKDNVGSGIFSAILKMLFGSRASIKNYAKKQTKKRLWP